MRIQRLSIALVAAIGLLSACTRPAGEASKPAAGAAKAPATKSVVVATVNGQAIDTETLNVFLQAVTNKPPAEATPEQKSQLLDQLINMTLAAQAGEKEGLQNDPAVQARIQLLRTQILAEAATEKYIKAHPVSESELKADYDAQIASMGKEYKARHILVDKDSEANDIIAQLKKGAKFEDLAKQSKDPGSKDKGGDLDWNPPTTFVKPFAEALTKLEKGKYTEAPVQTQFGWHVIQLDDVRALPFPAYDTVKPQLQNRLQEQEVQKYVSELRAKATIK
jgi:peptidyl-prolyl cis-trans isomerase C